MGQVIETLPDPAGFDLGRWLGRREAFAAIAGRCSAAEAETLRRIRDEKLYKSLGLSWDDFCSQKLGSSRRHVDRILRVLGEFGTGYFLMAQITHITPEEYRAIAPHISAEGVRWDGAVIALLPENSEQVSAAVAGLLEREKPSKEKASLSFDAMVKRCDALTEAIERMTRDLTPVEMLRLTTAISRLRRAAARKGAQTL